MSKEVKRYEPTMDSAGRFFVEEKDGRAVMFRDYQALRDDYDALLAERDSYKAWYDDALDASNIAGFAGMTAAQVISHQSEENAQLVAERDALRDALEQAAQSLESISKLAGRDEFMQDVLDIRGFANSRANVARAALQGEQP